MEQCEGNLMHNRIFKDSPPNILQAIIESFLDQKVLVRDLV
ncbi:hypothetical protein KSS87_006725, partial [Heliosperma pusillum]